MTRLLDDLSTVVLLAGIGAAALAVYHYPELFFSASDTSTMSLEEVNEGFWRDNARLALTLCAIIAAYLGISLLTGGRG